MENRPEKERAAKDPDGAGDDSAALIGALQHSVTRRSTLSQERWASLKKRYDPHLLAHARTRIGDKLARVIDAEEVVDEAWIRVFESWDDFQYQKKNALRGWLCLQVDRVILDRCRRERRHPPEVVLGGAGDKESSTWDAEPAAQQSGPATVCARNDRREKVVGAIERLPEIYRRVLKAVWIEEKSRDEVAQTLNIKPNTLTVQLKRGMELLRSELNQDLV
jgi:RNA polymerase sigma factor (sigma-70 family)